MRGKEKEKQFGGGGGEERERERRRKREKLGGEGEREERVIPFPSCEYTKHVMLALLYSLSGLFCRCACTVQYSRNAVNTL